MTRVNNPVPVADAAVLATKVAAAKVVIFDLFHTLNSTEFTSAAKMPHTATLLGLDHEAWSEQVFNNSRDRLAGIERDPVRIMDALARAINKDICPELVKRVCDNRRERFRITLQEIPETTLTTLTQLQNSGKRLALISNADVTEIEAWPESPLATFFDPAIFSCHVGYVKPEPEIYKTCLERLGVGASDCIFVGDGSCNELQGAREAGFYTIMPTRYIEKLPEAQKAARMQWADAVVPCLTHIARLL